MPSARLAQPQNISETLGTEPVDNDHVKDGWSRVLRISEEGESTPVGGPVSSPDDLKNLEIYHPQQSDFIMLMASKGNFGDEIAQVIVVRIIIL